MSQRPLSKSQKTQIGIASTAAWQALSGLGQIELPGDMAKESKTARMKFWVHQQISQITQRVCSASDMIDDEYLDVKSHFESLAGQAGKAFGTAHREAQGAACHRDPGCEYVRQIEYWMHEAGFKPGYMYAIMKGKFKHTDLTRLNERQLKQLHDTIVNRARAKLGLGDTQNRDKKQRVQRLRDQRQARQGQAPPEGQGDAPPPEPRQPSKSRDYVLRPHRKPDPDNEPF